MTTQIRPDEKFGSYLTYRDAAEVLGFKPNYVRQLANRGVFATYSWHGVQCVPKADVLTYLERRASRKPVATPKKIGKKKQRREAKKAAAKSMTMDDEIRAAIAKLEAETTSNG